MLRRCSQALTTIRNRSQPFATVRRFRIGPYETSSEAQHFTRVVLRVFFCQGCIKWWQRANHAAGVGHRESVIFPWQRQYLVQIRCVSLCVECPFFRGRRNISDTRRFTLYAPHFTLDTLQFTLYTCHSHFIYTLLSTLYTLNFTLNTLHSVLHTLHLSV